MSGAPIIVCPRCGSFKVHRMIPLTLRLRLYEWWIRPAHDRRAGTYVCEPCNQLFTVRDSAAHARSHPPDVLGRCRACDHRGGLELVERNHRPFDLHPPEEIIDLYRCRNCGQEYHLLVQKDPAAFYD